MIMLQMTAMINVCLNNFRKNKRNTINIFSRKCNSIKKDSRSYQEVSVKLTNTKLKKLRSASKNKTGIILRLNDKNLKMKNCHTNYFSQQDKQRNKEMPLLKMCQQI